MPYLVLLWGIACCLFAVMDACSGESLDSSSNFMGSCHETWGVFTDKFSIFILSAQLSIDIAADVQESHFPLEVNLNFQ
jgi:hypothetical protein